MSSTNGDRSTLLSRVKKLRESLDLANNQLAERDLKHNLLIMPVSQRHSCIVCRAPRLDPDVTGLTCGNSGCLASLSDIFPNSSEQRDREEREKEIRKLIVSIGQALCLPKFARSIPDEDFDVVEFLEKILKAVKEIDEALDASSGE